MDKVIDIEERIPSMREKRRRKTNKKFLFMLTVFVVALLAILYFQSPLSKIGSIIVSGAVLHEQSFYKEQSGLTMDNPLWSFSTEKVEKTLTAINGVKHVDVSRKWLRDIEIVIEEWETVAYLEEAGQYSLLLENGEKFPAGGIALEAEAPILNNFTNEDSLKQMSAQLLKMEDNVYRLVSEIIFDGTSEDADSITVYMDDGFEVRAVIATFAERMDFYPEITAQLKGLEKGVIDMEVGTFFSPFSKVYGLEGDEEEANPLDEENE
ncbi:cell division protein FtsQ/DivIB [Sporosarcina sp. YIM B06819]|uniref:cell division protein FtsQ/DivIB n=1 Tax=Sporosarcina sp. YIM B06819 TaxID=3081769 RepID=UPI00298C89E1|nr:cell division protein FtsQ/DivIB [Sporosarcina sp. YIM B06819]